LLPIRLLDRFQLAGVIVRWWDANQFDLRTLASHGFDGVIDGWVTTIETVMEDEKSRSDPLDHRLVPKLVPKYLDEMEACEAQRTELEAQIKAATVPTVEDDELAEEGAEETVSPTELRSLKGELTRLNKRQRELKRQFIATLNKARADLAESEEEGVVIGAWREDLSAYLGACVTTQRHQVIAGLENWWDKYAVSLSDLDVKYSSAATQLASRLEELGYV
jgi:type I restriction enzyme M protein